MEPHIVSVNSNNQFQHSGIIPHGLVFDNRDVGKLTYDSRKSGLTLGIRQSPYKFETTDGGVYIGDLPEWENPSWIRKWPDVKPWVPGPWVPQVSPPPANTHSYVYLNPEPPSPWHVTTAGDRITLILDVPGVKPEDINVQIESMKISVTGKRADNGFAVLHTWQLTNDYDPTTTEATMELGTLKLVIKKHINKQTHLVKVTVVK